MVRVGSARHDENGKYTGGKAGDSLQRSNTNDTVGEVSMQAMYTHSKGWYVLRPKSRAYASQIANSMYLACNNKNIGYSQSCQRKTPDNIETTRPINVDCSKLVRDVIYYATGVDVGNFTTANEKSVLSKSNLFESPFKYKNQASTPVYNGDILVTCTKGHTVVVIDGSPRPAQTVYYPKYTGTSSSIITALKAVGETDTTMAHRKNIALANGISAYTGTASQNLSLVKLLKAGKLIKV